MYTKITKTASLYSVRDNSGLFPSYKEVNVGSEVTFSCHSLKKWSDATWFFEGGPLPTRCIIVTGNTLTIYPVHANNSGKYVCYGAYEYNKKNVISIAALKVFGKLQ